MSRPGAIRISRPGRSAIALLAAVCLFGVWPLAAGAALPEVETTLQPRQAAVGEALVLQLRLRGAAASEEPDLTPLAADFEVLGVQRVRRMSLMNGARDSSFDFIVQIMPRRAGDLVVPALPIGSASSEAVPIQVSAAAPRADRPDAPAGPADATHPVMLEAYVDREDPYEHERVVLTLDLYTHGEVLDGALAQPEVPGATLEPIGEDRRIEKTIDGQRYAGIQRNYVLVPDAPGTLRVPPVRFEGRVRVPQPARRPRFGGGGFGRSFFDDFFSDAFRDDMFSGFFGGGLRTLAVESQALELQVRERPAAVAGQWWLPARNVMLSESLEPEQGPLRVGEPLTRRIEIRADGVSPSQLPSLPEPEIAGVKHYVEAPAVAESVRGTHRIDETTWIATQPGPLTLPAIELAWWDTQSDSAQKAVLPARTLEVLPALATSAPPDPAASATPAQEPAPSAADAPRTAAPLDRFDLRTLAALGAAVASAALLLGVGLVRRRRGTPPPSAVRTRRAHVRALRRACRRNDPAGAEAALRALSRPGEVAAQPLAQETARLMALRYSAGGADWQGAALWQAWRAAQKARRSVARARSTALPPLYPT